MHCILCVLLDSFLRQRNVIHQILSILSIGMEWNVIFFWTKVRLFTASPNVSRFYLFTVKQGDTENAV